MTLYYNPSQEKESSRPRSARTSNLWLNPEKLAEEGWYPVTVAPDPALGFGEVYDGVTYTLQADGTVLKERTVTRRSLAATKEWLINRAKRFIERRMQSLHGGVAEQVGKRAGDFGDGARNNYLADQATYVQGFQQFGRDVEAASTWAALESVYVSYPELHDDGTV